MKSLYVLRFASVGELVGDWQSFLRDLSLYNNLIDNRFGSQTLSSTKKFQENFNLTVDGIVGPSTWAKAISLGFHLDIEDNSDDPILNLNYPQKPNFSPILNNSQREALFGRISFKANPSSSNPEAIIITNSFERDNIVSVDIPQLGIATMGKYVRMRFHKACAYQLQQFFIEIEQKELLHLVKSFGGAYYPRFIRGSKTVLSNHSFGTAFDINENSNGLGKTPALVGTEGSVRELVPIANKWGFYWGGHFARPDGMHFEVAKIMKL